MTPRLLRAPGNDGGLLVDPPPGGLPAILAGNRSFLEGWNHDFQGRKSSQLRAQLRREVLDLAASFLERHGLEKPPASHAAPNEPTRPLVVTGHQPELFHPGVWIKNFAAAGIAAEHRGTALNLIVDNDLPKSASIRVPRVESGFLRASHVDFDRWGGDIPYEDLRVQDEALFASFADRARGLMRNAVPGSLLDDFWPRALARRREFASPGLRFSLARHEIEGAWGTSNLELPLSAVCQTEGFLWFVCHLLARLPEYLRIHNDALAEYRAAHGIRSKNHPVSALAVQGDWLEAPFWVWRRENPRRRGLLARLRNREIDLRIAGEDQVLATLPLGPDREACCAVERLRDLPAQFVRLRTRALTTTLFSRFLLSDLFIHGIGGSKYDELGDVIARRFFGIEPPAFLTVSLTLWLGVPLEPTSSHPAEFDRLLRSLTHNPDRHVHEPFPDELRILVRNKQELIATPVSTHRQRQDRCLAIRACNESMQPWVRGLVADVLKRRADARKREQSNRVAKGRDFAFVLHSADKLKETFRSAVRTIVRQDVPPSPPSAPSRSG
jgi:hypothetical protein